MFLEEGDEETVNIAVSLSEKEGLISSKKEKERKKERRKRRTSFSNLQKFQRMMFLSTRNFQNSILH